MSINNIKSNIGGVSQADLLKQQELTESSRKEGKFAGLSVKQVPPPDESPIAMVQSRPQGISTYTKPITNIDSLNNLQNDIAKQLQNGSTALANAIQQIQATAKGAENPNAFAGTASIEGIRKGEGANGTGLGEGVSPARRLESTNDPVRLKDSGETGAARKAASPTDQVAQIMAKVVELQKQLVSELSNKPNLIKALEKNQ